MESDPSAQGSESKMIYADTSFLLAMRVRSDSFHEAAIDFRDSYGANVFASH